MSYNREDRFMLKKVMSSALLAGFLIWTPVVLAEIGNDGFYITPEVGYVLPTNGKVDDTEFLGGKIGYGFAQNFAVEFESGYMEYKIDFSDTIRNVGLKSVPIMGNIKYSDCAFAGSRWYAYAGVGGNVNDLDSRRGATNAENTVAWQLGLGMEFPFAANFAGVADIRYFANDPKISREAADANKIDLNAVIFSLGVKFQ
jgi:hypothetical protein